MIVVVFLALAACTARGEPGLATKAESTTDTTTRSTTPPPTEPAATTSTTMSPITGYDDFTGQDYFTIDPFYVASLVVKCMNDQGLPAVLTPDGGISAENIPLDQNTTAQQVMDACMRGLSLPSYTPPTDQQITLIYQYDLALQDCLETAGFQVSKPPSLDAFIEEYHSGAWNPYSGVPLTGSGSSDIQQRCPPIPVGGYGAWQPGDPVTPRTGP